MSKKRFNIWLDKELIDTVKVLAIELGVKASTFMRMAILEKISRRSANERRDPPAVQQVQADEAD